jgi:hypothetical protein
MPAVLPGSRNLSLSVWHHQEEPDAVSIDSLQSSPWTNPWSTYAGARSGSNAASGAAAAGPFAQLQEGFSASGAGAPWPGQNAAGSGDAGTSPANPLQSLASDIQAMLIQAQSSAATGGLTGSTTAAATPEQSVTNDLQSLLGGTQPAAAPNAQTADSNPTTPTGETVHHHHHHHGNGDDTNGVSNVAGASTTATQTAGDQSVAASFATDIAQAIQAYGGGSLAAATPVLIA